MRRLALLIALLALLWGCGLEQEPNTVLVGIVETDGCAVVDNGRQVVSGSDVSFELVLEEGYSLSGVDYDGEYEIRQQNGKLWLDLEDVRYPTRLNLRLSRVWCTMIYHPNGAPGEPVTQIRDLQYHARPNTQTDLFEWEGYSLVSWNTAPDGSGTSVGLGSRVTDTESGTIELYAQWLEWSDEADFDCTFDETVTITAYHGTDDPVVIPEIIGGKIVTAIASGAFQNCEAEHIVLPKTMVTVEAGAFSGCALRELTLYDNVGGLPSAAFADCPNFTTLHINAQEAPYGYHYRRESMLADKLDLLILSQGQRKMVFYGGCSMWYNLDGAQMQKALGDSYRVINTAINGTINSAVQMQIITAWLEEGDIFFHTPELSSDTQLMVEMGFTEDDAKLWAGLEYNYDLLEAVDLRDFPGLLDSYQSWRDRKRTIGTYDEHYRDREGRSYYDPATGSIPFTRYEQTEELADEVDLDPNRIKKENMDRLAAYYQTMTDKGVRVYVSHACINVDAMPSEQSGTVKYMDELFRKYTDGLESVTVISYLGDYLFRSEDFYDTNYHLLTNMAQRNTAKWIRDLKEQMMGEGLWPE